MNPQDICTVEDRSDAEATWYRVKPADLYPMMVDRIKQVLADSTKIPPELDGAEDPDVDPRQAARHYVREAKNLPKDALNLVATPTGEVAPKDRQARADALELCRRWFTRALKLATKGRVGLHIVNDPTYRL